ncbi:MAG: hypothetical protein HY905_19240 [Deltaproteobacteria bacterium]|nr:hypothetical protein [Deltaproteobacteria bacterium]
MPRAAPHSKFGPPPRHHLRLELPGPALPLAAVAILLATACSRGGPGRQAPPGDGEAGRAHTDSSAPARADVDAGAVRVPDADLEAHAPAAEAATDAAGASDGSEPGDEAETAAQAPPGLELLPKAKWLWRQAACGGSPAPAEPPPSAIVADHCRRLATMIESYRSGWMGRAGPFFRKIVPADVPHVVVYPFGGADLLTALVVFPDAEALTTLGLEPAGDLRVVADLDEPDMRTALDRLRQSLLRLFNVNHSRTAEMAVSMRKGVFPTHLAFSFVALAVHGFEPVSLRYFALEPDGAVRYLEAADLPALDEPIDNDTDRLRHNQALGNVELRYRRADGSDPAVHVYRHICGDLSDTALAQDDRILRHLESLGDVAGLVKAASFLLWSGSFERVERWLAERVVWQVSDSTGLDPQTAEAAGLEQETWGSFAGPILIQSPRNDLVRLWRSRPYQPMPFVFGYPDAEHRGHLVVTRRPTPTTP